MEQESGKRTRRKNLQQIVLYTVATSGMLTAAVVAPNVIGAMYKMGLLPSKRQSESIKRAQQNLVKKELLAWTKNGLVVTQKGRRVLERSESGMLPIKKPRRWDRKWRMLIFDIPERKRAVRERMRRMLRESGFLCIQRSIWIHPYDCENAVATLKTDLSLGKEMLYVIVDTLEGDSAYRKYFELPLH